MKILKEAALWILAPAILIAVLWGVWKVYEIDPEIFPSPYGSTRLVVMHK